MKKILLTLLFSLSVLLQAGELIHTEDYEQGIYKAQKEHKNLVLFVYSSYCPWCKKMERDTLENKEVIEYLNKNYIFVAANQDIDEFPQRFMPNGTPTTYVIDPKTQEKLFSLRGYKSPHSFLKRLKR
jgi:thioredoxin-related protein